MRVLVAEDETLMRERLLQQLMELRPQTQVVAAVDNGLDAWEAYLEHEPEVVFLDIRMPGMSGLDVAERIQGHARSSPAPARIVFVTAYEQHALRAFEHGAVDYLLKPLERERLSTTLARIEQALAQGEMLQTLAALRAGEPARERIKWIKASSGRKIQLVKVDDVLFFQSDSRYTRVVHAAGEALIRTPLRDLLAGLDPTDFWQIHRSVVVNVNAIASVERTETGGMHVFVKGRQEKLPVCRAALHYFRE